MSILDTLRKIGYVTEKDPQLPPFGFYIKDPSGTEQHINDMLDTESYIIATDGSKISYTRRQIINELYSPTEEDWCVYENGYSLSTQEYLRTMQKRIGLIETRTRTDYEFVSTLIINTDFLTNHKENATFLQIGKRYFVQMPIFNNDDLSMVYVFVFSKKPTPISVHTAYRLTELMDKFYCKQLSEVFICCECGREIHWLDIQGDFRDKLGQLEDRHCGCNVEKRK